MGVLRLELRRRLHDRRPRVPRARGLLLLRRDHRGRRRRDRARLSKGRLGRAWKAVRDDEDAAEAMGINTYATKISAYIIGAVWAGIAGQLMATHLSAISPNSFQFLYSALILMAVVLGGMGSTPGVIIGALFVSLAPELLRDFAEWRFLIFGVLLVVVMLFRPSGLWPATAVLPWLKRNRPAPPPFTEAVASVPPSVFESTDGTPDADVRDGGRG
ncbi:branched-chain amino acid ABC transporter permease [Agromyces bauzanensis]